MNNSKQKWITTKNLTFSLYKYIISAFYVVCALTSKGQIQDNYASSYINIDKYTKLVLQPEYQNQFKDENDKKNFKKLREFLWEKNDLYSALTYERTRFFVDEKTIKSYEDKITELTGITEGKKDIEQVEVDRNIIVINRYSYLDSSSSEKTKMPVSYLKNVKARYASDLNQFREQLQKSNNLDSNIANVRDDIRSVYRQLDSTLAPEYKQQDFRSNISLYFTILIAILLIAFFVIVYKRSDNNLSKELLSGNGLQFVTLFVLIIAIILFGILSILGSSELAAILSGISGYILGKGTQKDLAATLSGSTTTINNTNTPMPIVTTVTPNQGNSAGGTIVRITGSGFAIGATVKMGGNTALITIVDSNNIDARAPTHIVGPVDVVVSNPDGKNATLTNGFTYI